ncbi:hypothetical protein [Flocculibacter collagenilyticus]|uniref:hypothetical protein n=1 Tax=Flocculibacter collagenilyticus TaxID=2744479 RepID=UPI003899552F
MKLDFSTINKKTADSFHQQKALIKKVLAGKKVLCPTCKQALHLLPPEKHAQAGIACPKQCTLILLEME